MGSRWLKQCYSLPLVKASVQKVCLNGKSLSHGIITHPLRQFRIKLFPKTFLIFFPINFSSFKTIESPSLNLFDYINPGIYEIVCQVNQKRYIGEAGNV